MSTAFSPSPLQADFFRWEAEGRGSCVLVAVAGSGKSTTIVQGLNRTRGSVLVLAFNASIVKEMAAKVAALYPLDLHDFKVNPAGRMAVRTFHSLGFGALCKHLGKRASEVETDGSKLRKLFKEMHNEGTVELYSSFVTKLVALAKGEGLGALRATERGDWYDLIAHHDLYLDSLEADEEAAVELAQGLLAESNLRARAQAWVDYDDHLYLPLLWRLRLWQHDWVFIDEAQDTNPVRRALAKLALRPGGRLVAVGDPAQAIYGFTGASHDALELIKREFNAREMPLTVSYRCPQAVGRLVAALVPHFQVHPAAPEGTVLNLPLEEGLERLGPHDVVLCRNVKPLVELAFSLVAQGVGCHVLGKEIGDGLAALVKRQRAKGLDRLTERLTAYRDREVAKHTAKGEEGKAEAVADRVACVLTVAERLSDAERTVPALLAKLESLFSDSNGVLTLSTAHKAKGREWARVAILRPDLMPSKWARQDWQQRQEQNLMYVAYTRAKEELILLEGEMP